MAGANLVDVDMSSADDRSLFLSTQKLFSILITVGQAAAYLFSGMFGNFNDIGPIYCALIVLQLFFAGIIVMLLDEVLQKGYGLGSGV